jgi:hypothetical protein
VSQVPTGLKNAYMQDQIGRKDALRLLAMTEPLLDSANSNIIGPAQFGVDIGVLKRNIIAVCQHATRITANESRILEVKSPVYVLGDIHGNISDLQFFRKTLWSTGPEVTAGDFLFLGDFVDRGRNSIPVIAYIMSMKILNPGKWHMIRGNHETREVNGNIEHYQDGSFLLQCLSIFGESDGYAVWEAVNNFFDTLALAATIDGLFCAAALTSFHLGPLRPPYLSTFHPSPFTLHPSPFTLHPSPFTLHPSPFTLHPISPRDRCLVLFHLLPVVLSCRLLSRRVVRVPCPCSPSDALVPRASQVLCRSPRTGTHSTLESKGVMRAAMQAHPPAYPHPPARTAQHRLLLAFGSGLMI